MTPAPAPAATPIAAESPDSAAIARLYECHARMVYSVALARLGRRDAEDVVQEVFLRASSRLGELRAAESAGAWLAAIARNAAIDMLRQRQRTTSVAEAASLDANHRPDAASAVVPLSARLDAGEVLAVIHTLPEAYREPLILRLVEGFTGPQIAEQLGMTHGSVRVNLSKGMAQLRAKLGQGATP